MKMGFMLHGQKKTAELIVDIVKVTFIHQWQFPPPQIYCILKFIEEFLNTLEHHFNERKHYDNKTAEKN